MEIKIVVQKERRDSKVREEWREKVARRAPKKHKRRRRRRLGIGRLGFSANRWRNWTYGGSGVAYLHWLGQTAIYFVDFFFMLDVWEKKGERIEGVRGERIKLQNKRGILRKIFVFLILNFLWLFVYFTLLRRPFQWLSLIIFERNLQWDEKNFILLIMRWCLIVMISKKIRMEWIWPLDDCVEINIDNLYSC